MQELARKHAEELQQRLQRRNIDLALIMDDYSLTYLASFWGYFGIDFGRPSFVLLPNAKDPILITPLIERTMAEAMTWISDIRPWNDDAGEQWDQVISEFLAGDAYVTIGVDANNLYPPVRTFLEERFPSILIVDISSELADMRAVKSPEEIDIMKKAGDIALSMATAARGSIQEGIPEYEVALAINNAAVRKAAEFLTDDGFHQFVSPLIPSQQVMQSGENTTMAHMRASVRRLKPGDAVYFCFCGMARFMEYKLGFDRNFFVGEISKKHEKVYQTTLNAQDEVINLIKPGAIAEEIYFAAREIYLSNGYSPAYRVGRGIGISNLEKPELKAGDKTILKEGMTLTADGGITLTDTIGIRISDSLVVTETGNISLTPYTRDLIVVDNSRGP